MGASLLHHTPNMKLLCIVSLGLVAVAWSRPSDILDIDLDNHEHEQEGEAGVAVEGEYSWVHPNGQEYVVRYIADDMGYRVLPNEAVEEPEADSEEELPAVRTVVFGSSEEED